MEKIVRQSLLFDFYGELLTDHQKRIYEDIIVNDLSYSEIAKEEGITRQGVYDLMKRCDKILEEYERKLRLIQKFLKVKEKVSEINAIVAHLKEENKNQELQKMIEQIEGISQDIYNEF